MSLRYRPVSLLRRCIGRKGYEVSESDAAYGVVCGVPRYYGAPYVAVGHTSDKPAVGVDGEQCHRIAAQLVERHEGFPDRGASADDMSGW